MPAITYQEFGGGLDRRLPINVQAADRLWTLRNAYITTGKKIKKRPCLRLLSSGLIGSYGLRGVSNRLKVFYPSISSPPSSPYFDAIALDQPAIVGTPFLVDIRYADIFQGYLYVVAEYYDAGIGFFARHHYIDGGVSTLIADAPQVVGGSYRTIASVTKAASRIFCPVGEDVKYCAAGDARDWTTASDAGFLPATLQQDTRDQPTAVGTFQDALVVFFPEGAQIWDVAVDPSANKIRQRLYGLGTSQPQSLASFAQDLVFLSPYGFRSIRVTSQTDRIDDNDVGVPIDSLVTPPSSTANSVALWIPRFGQYWCLIQNATTTTVWAYSFSASSKLGCWSQYEFPVVITGIATVGGNVYVRDENRLFLVDETAYSDNGTIPEVEVQMAFQDAKTPGVLKQFHGADFVFSGSWDVAYKYDPRDQSKETIPVTVSGDTRPGEIIPVEVSAPAIAPVFRHSLEEAAELDAVSLFYETLGLTG